MTAAIPGVILVKESFDKSLTVSMRKVVGRLDQCFNISLHNFTLTRILSRILILKPIS